MSPQYRAATRGHCGEAPRGATREKARDGNARLGLINYGNRACVTGGISKRQEEERASAGIVPEALGGSKSKRASCQLQKKKSRKAL
jgi:hypothetical protein